MHATKINIEIIITNTRANFGRERMCQKHIFSQQSDKMFFFFSF